MDLNTNLEQRKIFQGKDQIPYELEKWYSSKGEDIPEGYDVIKISESFYFSLSENSIDTVKKYAKEGMMIVTACYNGATLDYNLKASKDLASDLYSHKVKFIPTLCGVKKDKPIITNISYIVPYKSSKMSKEEFIALGAKLAVKHKQKNTLMYLEDINQGKAIYVSGTFEKDKITISLDLKGDTKRTYFEGDILNNYFGKMVSPTHTGNMLRYYDGDTTDFIYEYCKD